MRTLRLATSEIARQAGGLRKLAVAFLVVVPCLYGALYLWSNWDPYGQLEDVPVAVVNLDQAVTVDGNTVAAGDDLVETMKEDPIFGWVFTDADDAADGLLEGRYYLTITIPADFSADLASGADSTPQQAQVQIRRNDANGYVIGIMASTVQAELHQQINSAATQAYFESVYGDLDELRDGLQQADDGAHQLEDGLAEAAPGAAELASGLSDAVDGAAELSDGAARVADGTQQVADIVDPLAEEIVPRLPDVADGAADVTDAVASVTGLVAGGGDTLSTRTDEVDAALAAFLEEHPELADDPAFADLQEATGAVADRTAEVATALDQVNEDSQALNDDAQALVTAVPDLQQRILDGQAQIDELNSGAHQVADGAARLSTNLVDARDGSQELSDGIADAASGASDLSDGLDQLVAAVPALDPDQREANAAILGDPTEVVMTTDNPADSYGRGLAPFFFSISLWVFGIVVFLVLRPTTGRALSSGASAIRVALAGWLPIAGIGLAGAYLLLLVAQVGLGLDVVDPVTSIAVVTLAVLVFTLIAHLARTALGLVGSAVLLVLLMLQLTSSGGIYPVETLPAPLRAIHPFMPMSYLIDALRVAFTGGQSAHLVRDATVLGLLGVAVFALLCVVVSRQRRWSPARLHPALG